MWLCTANMLIKLEFVWLPSSTEGQLLWTTVLLGRKGWKVANTSKMIQMLQTQPYHIQIQDHIEKILDLLSDMLWPVFWDKFVQLFQPTHQFSWKLLLERDHQKVCASILDVPLRFWQWKVAVNDGDELLESTPSGASAPSILQAAEGIVRTVRKRCPSTVTGTVKVKSVQPRGVANGGFLKMNLKIKQGKGCMRFLVWGATWFWFFFEWHGKFPWLRHDLFIYLLGKTTIQR